MNTIQIGSYTFTDSDILSGEVVKEHSVIGESLSADVMTFSVHTTHTGNHKLLTNAYAWFKTNTSQGFVISDTDFNSIQYATPVFYYVDGNLQGKFYVTSIDRTSREVFKVECTSAVGLLITAQHYGGIYNGVTASTVLADILSGVTYTLDATLANATIRGYLPIASKRDNLQQVLFAIGGAVKVQSDGTLEIVSMSPASVGEISVDRIYTGGTVKTNQKYDGVQLTEHNYFVSQDSETLFDDTITGRQLITFDEPHHYIAAVDGNGNDILVYPTSTSQGVNYCIVQSTGVSSACTVTGKSYVHVERIIEEGTTTVTGSENIMSVTDAYLANPEIADTLAERVWNYAQCNKQIIQDIKVGAERSGDVVDILNPYSYDVIKSVMTKMTITLSGINKANTEYLLNYTPEGVISGFNYYKLVTSSCAWSKSNGYVYVNGEALKDDNGDPVTVDKIRIICVGGGSGGYVGKAGSDGKDSNADFERYHTSSSRGSGYRVTLNAVNPGLGGSGGSGGNAGDGGSIFELSINVANGNSGNIVIGSGGAGGDGTTAPTSGGNTTFSLGSTTYSSASGRKYPYGYTEAKSSLVLGNKGDAGLTGGTGGDGADDYEVSGTDGEDVGSYKGGAGSAYKATSADRTYTYSFGAGGGGASGSANGTAATNYNGADGANGGDGADATNYGGGGGGGHGGGGGGGASILHYSYNGLDSWNANIYNGEGGEGGSAGTGGDGKAGCLIIYY